MIKSSTCIRHFSVLLSRGCGVFGALGQSELLTDSIHFAEVLNGRKLQFKQVSAGWGHSAALTTDGAVVIFGRPFDFSTLFQMHRIYRISPYFARKISISTNSSYFGSLITKLVGTFNRESLKDIDRLGFFPLPIQLLLEEKVKFLVCSAGLTLFLTESGSVFSFGMNRWGQCGVHDPTFRQKDPILSTNSKGQQHVYSPEKITSLPQSIIAVDAGLQHCIALDSNGHVYTWGKAGKGQLGIGAIDEASYAPTKVTTKDVTGDAVLCCSKVSAGFSHCAVVSVDGAVYLWGKGMSDRLKEGRQGVARVYEDQLLPRRVVLPDQRVAVDICSSNFCSVVLANDGSLWALGVGEYDRNACISPLRVQTDYHVYEDGDQLHCDNGEKLMKTVYFTMPKEAVLKKGHQRVSVLFAEDVMPVREEDNDVRKAKYSCFEVVIHKDEAYLIEIEVDRCPGVQKVVGEENYQIVDYSSGWQHSLIIVAQK